MDSALINIYDLEFEELKNEILKLGEPAFRAKQVWKWIYQGTTRFDDMTDLPKAFRERLKGVFYIGGAGIVNKFVSQKDGTRKYLLALYDGKVVECVLMKYHYGNSVCISTQVGCRMGCRFCASSQPGFDRNLSTGEMIAQVMAIRNDTEEKISHIVLMGIGEPFDNYDNVVRFLRRMNSQSTLNISYRKMTVSTCGLVPGIIKFSEEGFPVNLSVSLHAPNDEIRMKIMPIAKRYSIDNILSACNIYTQKTGRRVTFEYTLIKDVNDRNEHAEELARKLSGLLCHINLIPVNSVEGTGYTKSERVESFRRIIEKYGIPVTVRRELGSDIAASCGQLRKRSVERDRMVD
jgi:23S rRNA (adenine2503-C2)-methyltransferase